MTFRPDYPSWLSRAVDESDAALESGGSGGSISYPDWLGIENQNGQTLAVSGGHASGNFEFDTVFDQGDGSCISWDVGEPTIINLLVDGWYSAVATAFFAAEATDVATAMWNIFVSSGGQAGQLNELGPATSAAQPPEGFTNGLSIAFPDFKASAGTQLIVGGGVRTGATVDQTLTFLEVLVVCKSKLT